MKTLGFIFLGFILLILLIGIIRVIYFSTSNKKRYDGFFDGDFLTDLILLDLFTDIFDGDSDWGGGDWDGFDFD